MEKKDVINNEFGRIALEQQGLVILQSNLSSFFVHICTENVLSLGVREMG